MKKTGPIMAIAVGLSLMGLALAQAEDVVEVRPHTSFEEIVIDDTGVGIDVNVGKAFSVILKGSETWVGRVTTIVVDNALVIGQKRQNLV